MSTEGIRYHWVITLQWGGVNSSPMASLEGTFTPAPGQTRQQAFRQLRDHAIAENESAGHQYQGEPVVIFFSLEPDELTDQAPLLVAKDGDPR